jgi:hypothetical protein
MEKKRLKFIFATMVACFLFFGGLSANANDNTITQKISISE